MKIKLSSVSRTLSEVDYDLFICSSSFEDRCLSIPQKIRNMHFRKIIVVSNRDGCHGVKNNEEKIRKLFKSGITVISVALDSPLDFADDLNKELSNGLSIILMLN